MPRVTETKAFADVLSSIEPFKRDLRAIVRAERGDTSSFDNLMRCAAHEIVARGAGGGARSTFIGAVDLAPERLSPKSLNSMFHSLLRENRDLFWLESVPGGGFYCHTPGGLFILGASTFVVQDDIGDASLAILSSGVTLSAKAPRLISFERKAMIEGSEFPFYDEVVTADFKYTFRRVNDYEVEAASEDRSWRVSLLDQFMDSVRAMKEEDVYLEAWRDLAMLINMHIEIDRRNLISKSKELEREGPESKPDVDWLISKLSPLRLITRAIKGFRDNRLVKESWERAFVAAQVDIFTDNFAWLDIIPTRGGAGDRLTLSKLFDMDDTTRTLSEVFCPVSYLTALAKVSQLRRYVDIEMKAEVAEPIETKKAADTRHLIDSAIDFIGKSSRFDKANPSHEYGPACIEVEWDVGNRRLGFIDRTNGHSAFAALDRASEGRNHLDRLAKRAGANVDYLMGGIAITLPEPSAPQGGGASGGGKTVDGRPLGRRGSFNKIGIPWIKRTMGGAAALPSAGAKMTLGGLTMANCMRPVNVGPLI